MIHIGQSGTERQTVSSKLSRVQNSGQIPQGASASTVISCNGLRKNWPHFGQYKPKRTEEQYRNMGWDRLDEADELEDAGEACLDKADIYQKSSNAESKLATQRYADSGYYKWLSKRAVFDRGYYRQQALQKKESAFFHEDNAVADAVDARYYKNKGLDLLDEADELAEEGHDLLDYAKQLSRQHDEREARRRNSAPTGTRPFQSMHSFSSGGQDRRHSPTLKTHFFFSIPNESFLFTTSSAPAPPRASHRHTWHGSSQESSRSERGGSHFRPQESSPSPLFAEPEALNPEPPKTNSGAAIIDTTIPQVVVFPKIPFERRN